jgi:hypothetical protein
VLSASAESRRCRLPSVGALQRDTVFCMKVSILNNRTGSRSAYCGAVLEKAGRSVRDEAVAARAIGRIAREMDAILFFWSTGKKYNTWCKVKNCRLQCMWKRGLHFFRQPAMIERRITCAWLRPVHRLTRGNRFFSSRPDISPNSPNNGTSPILCVTSELFFQGARPYSPALLGSLVTNLHNPNYLSKGMVC